jgi:hypothetical protein
MRLRRPPPPRNSAQGQIHTERGRKAKHDAKDRRIQELEKKLRAAEKELQIRQALIELQKKVSALLSIVPNSEES